MHLSTPSGLGCCPFLGGGSVIVVDLLIVAPFVGFCNCSMFSWSLLCVQFKFCNHLDGEERAGCFALFVFLVSHDCCVALPGSAAGLSAVCDCGIS